MLVSLLPVLFADTARQRQYEAVFAALEAEANAPATVLLGNLAAWTTLAADALLVRPTGWALLVLTPHAGHLTIPTLTYGTWQLDRQPLPGRPDADNPFAQYCQQLPLAHEWLSEQLGPAGAILPPGAGLALFETPLTFGPEVETQLHQQAAAHDFQLVAGAAQLPPRLTYPAGSREIFVTEAALLTWADELAAALTEPTVDQAPESFWGQKLGQLWRWLGAEDIPPDPPYGGGPLPDTSLRDQLEQARLQQLRQELQAELAQQRREAAHREAIRTQELAQLRQQLTYSTSSTAERLAEQQEKARLEAALHTARAELAARNRELDTRIQQLGLLIRQLQETAASPAAAATLAAPARPLAPAALRKPSYRRLYQAERWGLVGLVVAIIGAGGWGVVRVLHPAKNQSFSAAPRRIATTDLEEDPTPAPFIVYDTLAKAGAASRDTAKEPRPEPTSSEASGAAGLIAPAAPLPVDSTSRLAQPNHLAEPADSASPAP